jgi:hypothetical protein
MSTKTVQSTVLVRQENLDFIRAQTIRVEVGDARPNTNLNVFFDDENVTRYCDPNPVISNSSGDAAFLLNLPSGKFNTGSRSVVVTDSPLLSSLSIPGNMNGSASATFSAFGKVEVFQTTQTTTETVTKYTDVAKPVYTQEQKSSPVVETTNTDKVGSISNNVGVEIPPEPICDTSTIIKRDHLGQPMRRLVDPIAQSFFTYGKKGGVFVTSIELFFQSKDPTIPVRVEIRPLINGYPGDLDNKNPFLVKSVPASEVNISDNGSAATKFEFDFPVYLKEDSDYCFVVISNSKQYNMFISRVGERSFENGNIIFEQPYVGSLFKSENNVTWQPEQFEDVKFKLNVAKFNATDGKLKLAVDVPAIAAFGENFTTVSGSNIITYRNDFDHGLEIGSKISINTATGGTYNGIPSAEFIADHTVLSVPNSKTVTFAVSTNANRTGDIRSANKVTQVFVDSSGSGYGAGTTIVFGTPGSGAIATPVIENGRIVDVTLTANGTGYTTAPSVTLSNTLGGSGAVLVATVEPSFSVFTNKPMTGFFPAYKVTNFPGTSSKSSIKTTLGNYEGGNITTYGNGRTLEFVSDDFVNLRQNSLIASRINETQSILNGSDSAYIEIDLRTDSDNISPIFDNSLISPRIAAYSKVINNQDGETLTASSGSGSVQSITISSGGSGYTIAPIVNIGAPDITGGVQATATVTISGGIVQPVVTIVNAGSGYTKTPLITITRAGGDTTGTGAAAQAILTPFNTELLPSGGKAKSKYLTRKVTLDSVSTSIRLFCLLGSSSASSVDWYIRTSLQSETSSHDNKFWQRLNCDSERNRSTFDNEPYDYLFYLDSIIPYDTFDLKCVLRATDPTKSPIVYNYRVITAI